jgi:hypothetical protein
LTSISIDRMTLHVAGLSASDGRRLALLVAQGLGAAGAAGAGREVADLRLELTPLPGAGLDELGRQIVSELLHQVRRLP